MAVFLSGAPEVVDVLLLLRASNVVLERAQVSPANRRDLESDKPEEALLVSAEVLLHVLDDASLWLQEKPLKNFVYFSSSFLPCWCRNSSTRRTMACSASPSVAYPEQSSPGTRIGETLPRPHHVRCASSPLQTRPPSVYGAVSSTHPPTESSREPQTRTGEDSTPTTCAMCALGLGFSGSGGSGGSRGSCWQPKSEEVATVMVTCVMTLGFFFLQHFMA